MLVLDFDQKINSKGKHTEERVFKVFFLKIQLEQNLVMA